MTKEFIDGSPEGQDTGNSPRAWTADTILLTCIDLRLNLDSVVLKSTRPPVIVRVVGGQIDDVVMASIEYGVKHSGVTEIGILMHSDCGEVKAAQKALNGLNTEDGALARVVGKNADLLARDPRNRTDLDYAILHTGLSLATQIMENPALKESHFDVHLMMYETVGTKEHARGSVRVVQTFTHTMDNGVRAPQKFTYAMARPVLRVSPPQNPDVTSLQRRTRSRSTS